MRTKVVTAMLGILAAMLIAVDPAYAAEESRKATTEAAESETEETKKETKKATEKATEKPTEKETQNNESIPFVDDFDLAFSPEGNLILVDDFVTSSGKQFMTVMTKAGNTFYIIVDRDADGNRNVHFLNQVDERDLLALMEESEAEEASASLESEREEKRQSSEPLESTETKEPAINPEENDDQLKKILTIAIPVTVIVGVLILYLVKKRKSGVRPSDTNRDKAEEDDEDEYEL